MLLDLNYEGSLMQYNNFLHLNKTNTNIGEEIHNLANVQMTIEHENSLLYWILEKIYT